MGTAYTPRVGDFYLGVRRREIPTWSTLTAVVAVAALVLAVAALAAAGLATARLIPRSADVPHTTFLTPASTTIEPAPARDG